MYTIRTTFMFVELAMTHDIKEPLCIHLRCVREEWNKQELLKQKWKEPDMQYT